MSLQPGDSVVVHNFALQIDGVQVEYLSAISGLSNKQDVIQHVQNSMNGKPVIRKMPGISQGGEVTVDAELEVGAFGVCVGWDAGRVNQWT